MSGGYISFFNGSSVLSDADLANALPDFQSQVSNEFNWYWGLNAYLDINGGGAPITIVDYPGQNDPQGALGYHWVDGNYQPYAVIFAGLCQDSGVPVTGVISHELLEMMADQLADTVNLYDFGDGTGVIVIQEVCDPCEQSLYYEGPDGNIVSDFALPAWWLPGDPNPVDFLGVIPGPWQLASGGYISYQDVTLSGWQQVFGDKLQQDMAKAADALRSRITMGNPPLDMIRQLRLKGVQRGGAPSGQPQQFARLQAAAQRRTVLQADRQSQQEQESGQFVLGGRVQSRPAGKITIVKRQDVPQVIPSGQPLRQGAPQGDGQQRPQHMIMRKAQTVPGGTPRV